VLVADGTMRRAIEALLSGYERVGIRPLEVRVFTGNPPYDSEPFLRCQEYLRPFLNLASYALVTFDREGCGSTGSRAEIETEVEKRLARTGGKSAPPLWLLIRNWKHGCGATRHTSMRHLAGRSVACN
jgi:hypothetical protein